MRRTQIYLDEDQKAALRLLAAGREMTVSDIVRQAIDRLLRQELEGIDFGPRFDAVRERLQARIGHATDDDVENAFRRARARKHVAV